MKFRYYSPLTQIVIVGFVCFFCPGMFNALNGMGGGGQINREAANNANTALYSTFVLFGVLGGGIVNLCGIRLTMFLGGLTYALYSGSYVYYNHTQNQTFTVVAGALMGIGAGILWAAEGMVMMAYPKESEKGLYIFIFWVIFNLGGVIGGVILFAVNYHHTGSLSDSVYYIFVALELFGSCLSWALAPPSKVVRDDGSHVVITPYTNVGKELVGILKLFVDPLMLLLLPMCFTSNFFYSYHFGPYNSSLFNTRTRGFNNIWYWGSQMIGAWLIGYLLDYKKWSRRQRAFASIAVLAVVMNIVWGCTLDVQLKYTRTKPYPNSPLDYKNAKDAGGPIALYAFMGFTDALWQNVCYWILGCLTNDAQKSARYAGFYKGMQSLGAAISWQVDEKGTSYLWQLLINWILIDVSLVPMAIVAGKFIKEHTDDGVEEVEKEKITAETQSNGGDSIRVDTA